MPWFQKKQDSVEKQASVEKQDSVAKQASMEKQVPFMKQESVVKQASLDKQASVEKQGLVETLTVTVDGQPILPMRITKWYQDLLKKTVQSSPDAALKYAAIVTYPEAVVLATYPADFIPDYKGVHDIILALHDGDTSQIAEHGCYLGPGCLHSAPGKLDPGKAIYGTDGGAGGTDAFVAHCSVLIGSYTARPAASTRLLRKTAHFLLDQQK